MMCKMDSQLSGEATPRLSKSSILVISWTLSAMVSIHLFVSPVRVYTPTWSVPGAKFHCKDVHNALTSCESAYTWSGSWCSEVPGRRGWTAPIMSHSLHMHTIAHTFKHWWKHSGEATLSSANWYISSLWQHFCEFVQYLCMATVQHQRGPLNCRTEGAFGVPSLNHFLVHRAPGFA